MTSETIEKNKSIQNVGVLLFDNFETLDVFGPVEIFGVLKNDYRVSFYSEAGGMVKNNHGVSILSSPLENIIGGVDVFLIPGGWGTRIAVNNEGFIEKIKQISDASKFVLTVCTGSGLLAKTGLLENRFATSNKRAFDWAVSNGKNIKWVKKARWTVDGKYYTSGGVSAGMDMVLGFLKDRHDQTFASNIAKQIEYNWQEDKDFDNFSEQ